MRLLILIIFLAINASLFSQPKSYSFVFLNKKSDAEQLAKEQLDKIMEGHMANINLLAEEGKLIAAGPFEGGGGIFILNTTSIEEAKQWLSTDPGVKANRWNIEILPYKPRIGSVCIVSEPYEMVTYQFIRFRTNISKSTAPDYPKIFFEHDDYLKKLEKTGNIVTEGIFGEYDGGVLVLKGELEKAVIESDPAVQEGLLELDFKQLWIAKGAFCEK